MVAGIFSSILVEGNNDFSLRFNLPFEELNEEAMVVKGGILDAKKHSTIVFQEKENPKLIETSDNSELYIVGGSSRSTKGMGIGEKSFRSKWVWKININKIVTGPGNRFKALGNTRVTFFGSMLKATDLISSQLNGQEAKIMMNEEGERLDISTASQQPDIISILEPIVNRVKVDTIIANLGLEKLHCVEAVGFSR
ncbi:hypothetical protein Goklo_020606, partial [Gossypium klotzschianum]|nr:hypothetical protein [Gossypium klotzschianum]